MTRDQANLTFLILCTTIAIALTIWALRARTKDPNP